MNHESMYDIQLPKTDVEKHASIQRLRKVAVLYGGESAEREISLRSGNAILNALQEIGVDAFGMDVGKNIVRELEENSPDCAFIALHGVGGEDGKIQAVLEYLGIPYTGSGVLASALCMDKLRTKQLWNGLGIPTPAYRYISNTVHADDMDWESLMSVFHQRVMVKPIHEGSSIGMSLARNSAELKEAYMAAAKYDREVLMEQYISGREYTVAIVNGTALPPIRLEASNAFYDFEAKYEKNDTQYICPCGLDGAELQQLRNLAEKAFEAVTGEGWGRVDIMMNEAGQFFALEVNTVPGMTNHSLVPMAAKAAGYSFNELVLAIALQCR